MPDRIRLYLSSETKDFILKILLPSLIGVSIRIAVQRQLRKVSRIEAFLSFVIGGGTVFLMSDLLTDSLNQKYHVITAGVIAMTAQNAASFLILRFQVESVFEFLFQYLRDSILDFFNRLPKK